VVRVDPGPQKKRAPRGWEGSRALTREESREWEEIAGALALWCEDPDTARQPEAPKTRYVPVKNR
jgi:hypothetical protein